MVAHNTKSPTAGTVEKIVSKHQITGQISSRQFNFTSLFAVDTMRLTSILAAWLAAVSTTVQASPTARSPSAGTFPSRNGTLFSIDGVTKYFAGSNSYWISFLTNNADVDLVMGHVAQAGLKIFRIWGFNDVSSQPSGNQVWYQMVSASGSRINTGANGLQRLDAVVASAEKHGVKLIINFVNQWDDYGGMATYVRAFGGSKETWYTNTKAQQQYRTYIQAVVSRYKDSSAVFAWELANEPRCKGCATDVIFNWANSTSAYVKSLDPNHMVTLGDEGMGITGGTTYPFQFSEGTDFVKNLKIETLDFGTFHMYPQSCKKPSKTSSFQHSL
jgi:mannan endo-1,4-beta-mannosidase